MYVMDGDTKYRSEMDIMGFVMNVSQKKAK